MKLTIARTELMQLLTAATAVAPSHGFKPILQCAAIHAHENSVSAYGTDLETGLRATCGEADIGESGEVLLPSRKCLAVLAADQSQMVTLTSTDSGVVLKMERGMFPFATEPTKDFPLPTVDYDGWHAKLPAASLVTGLHRVIFAIGPDFKSYCLGGVRMEFGTDGLLSMVATDGAVIAAQELPIQKPTEDIAGIVPESTVKVMLKLLSGDAGDVRIAIDDNRFYAIAENFALCSALIEGRFPRWREAIDHKDVKHELAFVVVPTGQTLSAIRQLEAVVADTRLEYGFIVLELNDCELRATDASGPGAAHVVIPVESGQLPHQVIVRARRVSELLRAIGDGGTAVSFAIEQDTSLFAETDDCFQFRLMGHEAKPQEK